VRRRTCAPRRLRHLHQLRERALDRAKETTLRIAQIGKSFRNEITPQNFVFRTREFEQMEMEYFVHRLTLTSVPLLDRDAPRLVPRPRCPEDQLRLHEHAQADLSHYSRGTTDIEFAYRGVGRAGGRRQSW